MMAALLNQVRIECARLFSKFSGARIGIVSSVDANNYRCRVMLQPENKESGWLPITTPWVGNSWGIVCPPSPGDVVEVQFQEGDLGAGFVVGRFFSNVTRPPSGAVSGEFWLVHQTGSVLKFTNDGNVTIQAGSGAGTVTIDGNLTVTGTTTTGGNINLNNHVHGGIQAGGGNTGAPHN